MAMGTFRRGNFRLGHGRGTAQIELPQAPAAGRGRVLAEAGILPLSLRGRGSPGSSMHLREGPGGIPAVAMQRRGFSLHIVKSRTMKMKSALGGKGVSAAEVSNVAPDGFWLLVDMREPSASWR